MAAPVVLRNASDTYAQAGTYANKNFGLVTRMFLGTNNLGYITWANPIPARAKVVKATIKFYTCEAWPGAVTMSAQAVAAAWASNRLTWNNKPALLGPVKSVTVTAAPKFGEFAIDITDIMQSVANGQKWYGLRISRTANGKFSVWSTQASAAYRPVIEITWSEAPVPPTELSPRGGMLVSSNKPRLSFNFADFVGNRDMAAYQVQISTNADMSAPVYDSGTVAGSVPECDLSATAFTATAGTLYYWRVRTMDGGNYWSDYSATESFKYTALPTVTITAPSSGTPYVEEPTPPISWTLSSGVQVAYRLLLYKDNGMIWDSGTIYTAAQTGNIPKGLLKEFDTDYKIFVQVVDSLNRVQTGNDYFAQASRVFQMRAVTAVTPFNNVSVAAVADSPMHTVTMFRATMPDGIAVKVDGRLIETDLESYTIQDATDPTKYVYNLFLSGRTTHNVEVMAIVNGQTSKTNTVVSVKVKRQETWLCAKDGTLPVALYNPSVGGPDGDISAVWEPVDAPPVLITQTLHGETGSGSGRIAQGSDVPHNLLAKTQRNNMRALRKSRGGECYIFTGDEVMNAFIYALEFTRVSMPDGTTEYDASFSYICVDMP